MNWDAVNAVAAVAASIAAFAGLFFAGAEWRRRRDALPPPPSPTMHIEAKAVDKYKLTAVYIRLFMQDRLPSIYATGEVPAALDSRISRGDLPPPYPGEPDTFANEIWVGNGSGPVETIMTYDQVGDFWSCCFLVEDPDPAGGGTLTFRVYRSQSDKLLFSQTFALAAIRGQDRFVPVSVEITGPTEDRKSVV